MAFDLIFGCQVIMSVSEINDFSYNFRAYMVIFISLNHYSITFTILSVSYFTTDFVSDTSVRRTEPLASSRLRLTKLRNASIERRRQVTSKIVAVHLLLASLVPIC